MNFHSNYYYKLGDSGINTRMGAQLLVESSVFESSATKAIFSDDSDEIGYAVVSDVDLGGSTNTAETGTLKSVPYSYTKLGSGNVKASVTAAAGQTLSF
jgi:pectate lyase